MTGGVDWSKAGTRIRWQPCSAGGRNPDWNWVEQRWKTAAEYAGERLTFRQAERVPCPLCLAAIGAPCRTARNEMMPPHAQRRAAAGQLLVDAGEWKVPDAEAKAPDRR